ncbi:hypothetical protein D3C84_803580 [compost metagenome]
MASNLTERLATALKEQQKESTDHLKKLNLNIRKYYRNALKKLKDDIISKDLQLSELTDLIDKQQQSLKVMQTNFLHLKILLGIMTFTATASVIILLITTH